MRQITSLAIIFTLFLTAPLCTVPIAGADDFGCKALLCLATPGGPKKFAECVPTIEKLYRKLSRGESMPPCDMGGDDGGLTAEQGYEEEPSCEESYGYGYTEYTYNTTCGDDKSCTATDCRKYVGYKTVEVCDESDEGHKSNCRDVKEKIYSVKPKLRHPEPNWIQVTQNGQPMGEKFRYRIK